MAPNLSKLQWLTVAELAEAWAPELAPMPVSAIKRELLFGLYKIQQLGDMREPLERLPDPKDLPPEDTLISRKFIERFCTESEEWQLPAFWFEYKEMEIGPSFPGRPSIMRAIVQELCERHERGELCETVSEQAHQLQNWAKQNLPTNVQLPTVRTIENGIRAQFRLLSRGEQRPE